MDAPFGGSLRPRGTHCEAQKTRQRVKAWFAVRAEERHPMILMTTRFRLATSKKALSSRRLQEYQPRLHQGSILDHRVDHHAMISVHFIQSLYALLDNGACRRGCSH